MPEETCAAKSQIGGPTDLNWDVVQAAPITSQATGVLAAIVFAGVILLLQSDLTSVLSKHYWTRALIMLLYVFFGFMVTSFLYVIIGGEVLCQQGFIEDAFGTMLLVIGAAAMLLALCWLTAAYVADRPERPVMWIKVFTLLLTLAAWVYLEESVLDAAQATGATQIPGLSIIAWGLVPVISGVAAWLARPLRRWLSCREAGLFTLTMAASVIVAAIAMGGFAWVTALDRAPGELAPGWQHAITGAATSLIGFYVANVAIIKPVPTGQPSA